MLQSFSYYSLFNYYPFMRRHLLSLLVCCWIMAPAFAGKEDSYVLHEGFESGSIPVGWTQESGTAVEQQWVVESALSTLYPKGTAAGQYRAALRNTTAQTQHYVSKLISPVFNIEETFQPIVVFSHAQPARTGDVDTLRVYYRTSATTRWIKLGEYSRNYSLLQTQWATDTISLPAKCATYQLAFEGTDNYGYGIALDEIIVRPLPTCDDPNNVSTEGLTASSALLRWNGSLDADSFHIVLTTTKLDDGADPETLTDAVKDTFTTSFQCAFTGLERNTTYYAHLQSFCNGSTSEWTLNQSFKTQNIDTIPYVATFNMNYVSGTAFYPSYWTVGSDIYDTDGNQKGKPYINTFTSESSWKNYSYSQTTCLAFTKTIALGSPEGIPAGNYSYAATPELAVDDISTLLVSFWGSCYKSVGDNYAGGIIVGVMTDPADFATFVPVDTVYITKQQEFNKFYVYLDSYKGEGKYVAFASNFHDKDNVFLLDDVEIDKAGKERYITNFEVTKVLAHKVTINANLQGAAEAEIIIARDTVDANGNLFFDPSKLPASAIITKATVTQAQLPYTIDNPAEGCFAQVYIHQTNTANYSLPKKILCPMRWDGKTPLTIGFEDDDKDTDGNAVGKWAAAAMENFVTVTYSYTYPFTVITTSQDFCDDAPLWPYAYSTTGNGYNSKTAVFMGKEQDARETGEVLCEQANGDYIALPEVEDFSNVVLKFYLQGYKNDSISNISVGVLSDPFDVSTFDTILTIAGGDDVWTPYTVSFANYKGKGKYPALLAGEAASPYWYSKTSSSSEGTWITWKLSYQRVDNITLSPATGCIEPTNVALTATDTAISLAWDGLGMTEWVVRIYSAKISSATTTADSLLYCDTVTTASYKNTLLKPHTRYFYSVTTLCEDSKPEEITHAFMTKSSAAERIPYIEDFENCLTGSTFASIEPVNWYYPKVFYSSSYYPYIYSYELNAHSGKNSVYFYYPTTSTPAITSCHLALPLMAEDLNKLQLQFYAKPGGTSYIGDTIWVGVMSDPADFATFDTVALFRLSENAYKECIVRFDTYAGKGKYIAFAKPLEKKTRNIYIDDVKVDYLSDCEKIQEVSARNASTSGADIYWQTATATKWEVVLTTDTFTLGSVLPASDKRILADSVVSVMPFRITSCPTPNTQYYAYVRAVCDESSRGEWSAPAGFKTTCVPLTAGEMGVIDFTHTDELDCWTVGVREGTTSAPYRNTNNYLYIFNTAASDGAYAAMPPLDIDSITRLQVSFDAHGGSTADYLREITVGVITNPYDLSTFTAIKTLSLPRVTATTAAYNYGFDEAQRYTVRFDAYMGDYNGDFGKQIMFLSESGESKNYVYIRNIKVDTVPACAEPVLVEAKEVNPTDALIGWEDMGGDYEVCLLSADGKTVVADTLVKDTTAVHFYNLDAVTKYQTKVRHICGVGDTSAWSNALPFKTICPVAMPLPYAEDFEGYASGAGNLPDCWEGFTNSSTAYPYVYTTAKKEGTNGFYLYRTTSYYSYAALPLMNASIKDLQLSFYYRNVSTSYTAFFEVGVATDITSVEAIDSTFVLVDSIEVVKYSSPNNVWHYYSEALSKYTGPEGHLVLRAPKADKTANSGCIYIDNLYIEKAPSCFRPINFAFVTATPSTVTLTWEPYGKETQWDIAYVPTGTELSDATPLVLADTTTFVVTGLTHSTKYDFYVRAHCSDTEFSDWSTAVTASTYCKVALADAHWEFDSLSTQVPNAITPTNTSYKQEAGWVQGNTLSTSISYNPYNIKNTYYTVGDSTRYYHYAYSDSCALYLGCTSASYNGAYAILPLVDADLDTLQITFMGRSIYATGSKVKEVDSLYTVTYAQGTYAHAVKVGTLTDPYDLSTFELLDTYTFATVTSKDTVEGGHWEKVTVPFYGAKGKYIALLSPEKVANVVYIDNVVIEGAGCNYPTHLEAPVCEHDTAAFTWLSPCGKWNVKVVDEKNNVIDSAEGITTAEWGTGKLTAQTTYTFSVQGYCSDDELSGWRSLEFTTPCAPVDSANFVYDFEKNLYKYTGTLQLPDCWTGGLSVGTTTTYFPQSVVNTTTYQYARNTGTTSRALRFYNSSSNYGGYAILPELDVDYETQALHFWARAAYFYTLTHSYKGRLYTANSAYQKSIVIGAIADETDLSTFVPLDTFTYSQSWSSTTNVYPSNDPTGNSYWEEVVIPLADYKGKGRIMILYPGNGTTGYFFIDDMDIVESSFCSAATNLSAANVTSTSALLQWFVAGTDSVKLQVATDEAFADKTLLVDTTLVNAAGKFALGSLTPATTYYFRLQHLCSEEETADWVETKFQTDYAIRFFENFSAARTYPENWNRASVLPSDIFSGTKKMEDCYATETATNWQRAVGSPIASNGIYAPTSTGASSVVNHWLLTPTIDLTTLDKESILQLSFLLGISNNDNNGLPNTHTPTADEPDSTFVQDKFFVAISEDAGDTWTLANTIWWSDDENDEADYSYATLTNAGELFHIDLSEYIGERIRIAFVNYSTKTASKNCIHLAHVSLNTTVVEQYTASICRWNDYSDENFTIPETTLKVGNNEYMRYTQAAKSGVSDTYTVLNLTVFDNAVTTIHDTICAGEDYADFNFSISKAEKSNVYKQKLTGTNTCDSIVELDLYVRPRLYTDIFQTICQGDYYEYNGERYYVSTVKSDTLSSLVTGCDSIVTLRLTVNEILTGTTDYHLCEGDYVEFGKYGKITASGTYVDTLKNAIGCDSVATLNVFAHKTERTTVRGAICQGDRYSYDVWAGLSEAGDYPSKQTSVYGCDSIVTLHLMVAGEDLVLRDSITTDKLPYVLNGEELLGADTQEGLYTKIVDLRCGEVTLVITVGKPTGINNIFVSSLALAQNPVAVGQDIKVLGSFAADATLDVISATGGHVYHSAHLSAPVVIPGLPTAGVYLVVVKSGTDVLQSKLIVK